MLAGNIHLSLYLPSPLPYLYPRMQAHIILGCTAAVISSACQSIGLILQRKSYLNNSSHSSNSSYNRSLWHFGLFLFIFSNIFGSSIQITSLPLIILSPIQSIGLVFNNIFHAILLNEKFTQISLLSTIFITIGAFLIAYCGNSLVEPNYNLKEFLQLLKNSNFIYWIIFISLIVVSLLSLVYLLATKSYYDLDNNYNAKLKGLIYGLLSGILSAFSLLLAKSTIEIIISTFIDKNWISLNNNSTYLIILTFLSICLSQLILINKGLKNISTSILYPLIFLIYNLISIINSIIFFKQWNQLSWTLLFILIIGLMLISTGVCLLSLQNIDTSITQPSYKSISLPASPMPTSPISNEDNENQYISFDTLRDMANLNNNSPSIPESIKNFNDDENLNILQPIFEKMKKQTNELASSSYKSSISFSLFNNNNNNGSSSNNNTNTLHSHDYDENLRFTDNNRSKNNSSSLRYDLEYNPNNSFNYSFNNTLEEIQNQLNQYDNNEVGNSSKITYNDISNLSMNQNDSLEIENSNNADTNQPLPELSNNNTLQVVKKNNGGSLKLHLKTNINGHKRVLSYEQRELLNALKK